ncbi:MAG: hypothetical protein QMD46_04190 [Methanomicrobiales archaeon]|nr:hypothetical protein [Methanomicrobiales archaeon]MDI6876510.1 hypothetical protein [Methanomicrobiales archaeon]
MTDETASMQFLEKEFWKRYMHLRSVLLRRSAQRELVERLRSEEAIADALKDAVIHAVNTEIAANRTTFFELLEHFVVAGANSLHAVDIEILFTVIPPGTLEVHRTLLIVDGREEAIPTEIGHRLVAGVIEGSALPVADALQEFYRREEQRYDALLGGCLERCSLHILEEIYPVRCYHGRIRLPASVILDYQGVVSPRV